MSDPLIWRLQHTLARAGYEPGPLDGEMGRRTRQAIIAAERDAKLGRTGQPSGLLLAVLDRWVARTVSGLPLLYTADVQRIAATYPAEHHRHLRAAMVEICATPLRTAHFLAQLAHESGGWRYSEEIASGDAYEGRKELGNVNPGDGRRYKGRGVIQLTGRANYARYGAALGLRLEQQPGLAALPEVAYRVAAFYWLDRNINADADRDDLKAVTRAINGGTNGLDDRRRYLQRAKEALRVTVT
jgi:putative chitinase